MEQTREAIAQNLAERWCWQAARRDDVRIARRLYRKQVIDGVYRLDEGAVLDDFFHFLHELGVADWLTDVQGTAIQRVMVPFVQYILLYRLKTLCGIESMHALPALLFSDEALMRLVGFHAQQVRQGVCQRGAATRQGPRATGPIGPDALAENIVQLRLRDLEALFNGVIEALAKTGGFTAKITGIVDATDLETTAPYEGCGQVTRKRQMTDKRGTVHEMEVTVYGWQLIVLIDAHTKLPLAATVVPIQEHDTLSLRALVTPARTNLAGHARRHKVVFDRGFWDGVDWWWLAQHGLVFVVPAKEHMAVTVDARAQAAAGEGVTVGRRAHTVRHGQGRTAWSERPNRRDFQPTAIHAVVVRTWNNRKDGPGGNTVFLTKASVEQPLQPFDDDDERRLIEHCGIKESKQPWSLKHPPQKTARAVRVHVIFTLLMFALATAYRLQCAQEEAGAEPIGWQRWRRQLLEQTRDKVIVFAQGPYGIFHLAEYSLLVGVKLKDVPPDLGSRPQVLAKDRLPARG
jgi:hypothetical protein